MTTKAQELKTLEQIRKLVEGPGEDSYIGMAFEGCFEIAEDNIRNDWGCSLKQEVESQRKLLAAWDEKCKKMAEEIESQKNRADTNYKALGVAAQDFQKEKERADEAQRVAGERLTELVKAQSERDCMKDEIIRLKARLFDLMDQKA